jgi:glycosyltransferase involved in cell wall biosynthesis
VIVDPRARLAYASYYIQGIVDLFGAEKVCFQMSPFQLLVRKYDNLALDEFFAFIIIRNGQRVKIVIDYKDNYTINNEIYSWCDVYGKVNLNTEYTDLFDYKKLINIGPGFGIRIWGYYTTIRNAMLNFIRSHRYSDIDYYPFFYGYYWQTKRLPITDFTYSPTDGKYVFFVSTLWNHDNCIKNTNVLRAAFIEECLDDRLNFEGGLYAKQSNIEYNKYKHLVYSNFISFPSYIRKTKRSSVVFNTPTVFNCHGWKLSEYFALGKAIISTPLINKMPVDLEHGKNIHFIEDVSEMKVAIRKILSDNKYRATLEKGALEYYRKYLGPEIVIKRILQHPTCNPSIMSNE